VTDGRERVEAALAEGWTFAGLYAVQAGGPVRVVLANDDGTVRLETLEPVQGAVRSIVDVVPAAGWDEREAHDLYGIRFATRGSSSPGTSGSTSSGRRSCTSTRGSSTSTEGWNEPPRDRRCTRASGTSRGRAPRAP
jgi:hypothetical protein